MKRFALFSFSILCLMLAVAVGFHLGSHSAMAQAPEAITGYRTVVVGSTNILHFVMLSNGDVYVHQSNYDGPWINTLQPVGNFWSDAPVSTSPESWGAIKDQYKK